MTFPLPTDTAHVRIESRQFKLGMDLGEGIRRSAIKVGAVTFAFWFALCWLLGLGIATLWIWLLPPALVTWRAVTRDASGRLRLASWADRARWWTRRQRPIVNGGTATHRTARPIRTRLAFQPLETNPMRTA